MSKHNLLFLGFLFFDVLVLVWGGLELWGLRRGGDGTSPPPEP